MFLKFPLQLCRPDRGSHTLGGFSGAMRCGKYTTFDGGSRVPTIAHWPGHIQPGVSRELLSHLDIWPTLRRLSGSSAEDFDVILDGYDVTDVLLNGKESPRKSILYYNVVTDPEIGAYAVRNTQYKAHFFVEKVVYTDALDNDEMCRSDNFTVDAFSPPALYDLLLDPEERFDISGNSEDIVQLMTKLMEEESRRVTFGTSVIGPSNVTLKLCCNEECEEPTVDCCDCPSLYNDDLLPLPSLPYADCTTQNHFTR
ncbi:arylsulfatase A-like [Antedon mediterranea]|uniref:arylsulfatase A-like n=1 Tax=Antedon mediterranea TaxID=105859 RepID=UPI003AF9C51F